MSDARAVIDAATSEADFQWQVIRLAQLCGFAAYHTRDSRGSAAGFPDLVLAHPGYPERPGHPGRRAMVLFCELKRTGRSLTPSQQYWRDVLLAAGADWRLWRPADWETAILPTLKGSA